MVMEAGQITDPGKIDSESVVRSIVKNIGLDSFLDDSSSVGSNGLNCQDCDVMVRINKQSPDVAGNVHVGNNERLEISAGKTNKASENVMADNFVIFLKTLSKTLAIDINDIENTGGNNKIIEQRTKIPEKRVRFRKLR